MLISNYSLASVTLCYSPNWIALDLSLPTRYPFPSNTSINPFLTEHHSVRARTQYLRTLTVKEFLVGHRMVGWGKLYTNILFLIKWDKNSRRHQYRRDTGERNPLLGWVRASFTEMNLEGWRQSSGKEGRGKHFRAREQYSQDLTIYRMLDPDR